MLKVKHKQKKKERKKVLKPNKTKQKEEKILTNSDIDVFIQIKFFILISIILFSI